MRALASLFVCTSPGRGLPAAEDTGARHRGLALLLQTWMFRLGVGAHDVVVRVDVEERAGDAETFVSLLPCLVCLYAGNTFARIKVSWKPTAGEGEMESDEFDTVLLAIGRYVHVRRTHI